MPRKKTNYERKGLARFAGSLFSPPKEKSSRKEGKWRPRKQQFERLHADDEDSIQDSINLSLSIESDAGEYKRALMFEKKKAVLKRSQKRNLGSIILKPSARDSKSKNRSVNRQKKQRAESNTEWSLFDNDSFAFSNPISDESVDDYTMSSKQTASTRQTALYTVSSDPTDFFSAKPAKLTRGNLDLMAAMSNDNREDVFNDGIENRNPRSEFHQFTTDEDKESTVILPVEFSDEDTTPNSEEYNDDTDSVNSLDDLGAKGVDFKTENASNHFFSVFDTKESNKSPRSLTYSPSSTIGSGNLFSKTDRFGFQNDQQQVSSFWTPTTKTKDSRILPKSQPRPSRDYRQPLSPLNIMKPPNSMSKIASMRKNSGDRYGFVSESKVTKPDPDATWSNFSKTRFEKKPDPTGFDQAEFFALSKDPKGQAEPFGTNPASPSTVDENSFLNSSLKMSKKENDSFQVNFSNDQGFENRTQTNFFDSTRGNNLFNQSELKETQVNRFENKGKQIVSFDPSTKDTSFEFAQREKKQVDSFEATGASFNQWNGSSNDNRKQRSKHSDAFGFDGAAVEITRRMMSTRGQESKDDFMPRGARRMMAAPVEDSTFPVEEEGEESGDDLSSRGESSKLIGIAALDKNTLTSGDARGNFGKSRSRQVHVLSGHVEKEESSNCSGSKQSSSGSYEKPQGLPNNAIMASMLFRTHHNVDTHAVEAKIKAQEEENSRIESARGDVPEAIQAFEDTYSCVSSFSEDTSVWKKPSKDLVDYFATSRRTDWNAGKYLREQRKKATELFEA